MTATYPEKLKPLANQIRWLIKKETGQYIHPEWITMLPPIGDSVVVFAVQTQNNDTILVHSENGKDFKVKVAKW